MIVEVVLCLKEFRAKQTMRGRSDGGQRKRLITSVCVVAVFLAFVYVFYGSIFGSSSRGASALEYGSRSLRKLGYLGGDDEEAKQDESSTKFGLEDGEGDIILKSFPVSSLRPLYDTLSTSSIRMIRSSYSHASVLSTMF